MTVLSRLVLAARHTCRLRKRISRGYGSAAAVQIDYDYDDEAEPHGRGMEESDGWETMGRGVQWVIMGDPMVRRHVYAERLAKLLDIPHISMGSLVRQELNPGSPLYKTIASAVNQGKLVPEDVIFGLLTKRLEEGYFRGETGFILDGIPRTRIQAEVLDGIADIDLVVNLKCMEECVRKKYLEDGMYSPCQAGGYLSVEPQTQRGHFRGDADTFWKEKLRMYVEQRKPVEEYYRKQGKLLDFQVGVGLGGGGDGDRDAWESLLAALQLQHMNSAVHSSHKLTA